jgi:hypothetical protein
LQGGPSGWDQSFSDPRKHDPKAFRYLVHGLQDVYSRILQLQALFTLKGKFDSTQHVDLSETPGLVRQRKVISASVIDQNHLSTFGGAGLILSCPVENVIDLSHQDLGTNFANPDTILARPRASLPALDQILEKTGKGATAWNEVRLTGTTDFGEVGVVGYWIKVDERGKPQSPEIAKRMRELANSKSFPLITFVVASEAILDQPAEIHETVEAGGKLRPWAVSVNKNGLRYFINLETGEAKVVNRFRESRPMTSQEALDVKGEIVRQIDSQRLSAIADRLEFAFAKCSKTS